MSDDDDKGGRQSANLVRHLNGQHPTTVLLLARHAPGGRPDAAAAELTSLEEQRAGGGRGSHGSAHR